MRQVVKQTSKNTSLPRQGTTRRDALLREIADAQARLGRLLINEGISLPISAEALEHSDEKARLAVVLARKIQDLRDQIAPR